LEICRAQTKDIDTIIKLWKELMRIHAQQDSYFTIKEDAEVAYRKFAESNIDNPQKVFLVAFEDGNIIGYVLGGINWL
jgi:hypothetical protein